MPVILGSRYALQNNVGHAVQWPTSQYGQQNETLRATEITEGFILRRFGPRKSAEINLCNFIE